MRNSGFSLIETMIALLGFLLLASLVWPQVRRVAERQILRGSAQAVTAELSAARSRALGLNQSVSLAVAADRRAYAVAAGGDEVLNWRVLPRGVRFTRTPAQPVTFHSRGGAAPAGTFELGAGTLSTRVVVSVGGRVRWEWG
jgi:Tfp pilus assembly protein FimT